MNATSYYIDTGRGLRPAAPARIVCYPEGGGEWTVEAQDADGSAIRNERGGYLAVWHDEEALDDFQPIDRDGAVAEAARLAAEIGLPTLPIYEVAEDDTLTLVAGGAS